MDAMIDSLFIEPTEHTPKVVINTENIYDGILLELSGESVPENTQKFYEPVFQWLHDFDKYIGKGTHETGKGINIILNFRMEYFNSASAKIFIMLMEYCSGLKKKYHELEVTINWHYNDEDILDAGQEFKSLIAVPFNIVLNNLFIKGKSNSPTVIISPEKKLFEISGKSHLERAIEFYEPVLDWLSLYGVQYFDKDFRFDFKLNYFNTTSSKMLLIVLQKLDEIFLNGKTISINWYYEEEDELEDVQTLTANLKVPVNYIKM